MVDFVEVKTADLVGAALDWAVAKVEGWRVEVAANSTYANASTGHKPRATGYRLWLLSDNEPEECTPSTDWSQCGPLIDSRHIMVVYPTDENSDWEASCLDDPWFHEGPTAQIAICRAILAAKIGDTVSVPAMLWSAKP